MLKKLAAIGLGAALILSPVVTMAQTTPAPTDPGRRRHSAAMPMKPMAHKMKHKAKAKHVVKKPAVKKPMAKKPMAKKPMPAAAPTATPKS